MNQLYGFQTIPTIASKIVMKLNFFAHIFMHMLTIFVACFMGIKCQFYLHICPALLMILHFLRMCWTNTWWLPYPTPWPSAMIRPACRVCTKWTRCCCWFWAPRCSVRRRSISFSPSRICQLSCNMPLFIRFRRYDILELFYDYLYIIEPNYIVWP